MFNFRGTIGYEVTDLRDYYLKSQRNDFRSLNNTYKIGTG